MNLDSDFSIFYFSFWQCFGFLCDTDTTWTLKRWKDRYSLNPPTEQWSIWAVWPALLALWRQNCLLWSSFWGLWGKQFQAQKIKNKKKAQKMWIVILYWFLFLLWQFFDQAGFPCPALRNPSDHFLRCINSDFDKVKATLKGSMKLRVNYITLHWISPMFYLVWGEGSLQFLLISCYMISLRRVMILWRRLPPPKRFEHLSIRIGLLSTAM